MINIIWFKRGNCTSEDAFVGNKVTVSDYFSSKSTSMPLGMPELVNTTVTIAAVKQEDDDTMIQIIENPNKTLWCNIKLFNKIDNK